MDECDAGKEAPAGADTWFALCDRADKQVEARFDQLGCPECAVLCGRILCRPDEGTHYCAVLGAGNPCLQAGAVLAICAVFCTVFMLGRAGVFADIKLTDPRRGAATSEDAVRHARETYARAQGGTVHELEQMRNPLTTTGPSREGTPGGGGGSEGEGHLPAAAVGAVGSVVLVPGASASSAMRQDVPGLAEALLMPQVPKGWQRREQCGKVYWYNPTANCTQYEPPSEYS